jgi:uncharacterized protein (DUF885 family)
MKRTLMFLCLLQFFVPALYSQQGVATDSARVESLFDNYLREYLALNPEAASQLGLPRSSGYNYDRAGLNDLSEAGLQANIQLARKFVLQLRQLDPARLNRSQSVDAQMLRWMLELQLEGEKFLDYSFVIDHLSGPPQQFINLMTVYHGIENLQDARYYLTRLERFPVRMQQSMATLQRQEGRNIRPPTFVIDRVIADMGGFSQAEPESSLLYIDFRDKLAAVPAIDSGTAQQLCRQAAKTIRAKVNPVMTQFVAACKASRLKADSTAGAWRLPDGEAYYRYSLKSYTTSSLAPDQVYDLGVKEVKRLQDQARVLMDSLGIREGKTFGELMQAYYAASEKPELVDKFYYKDGPEVREQILRDYRTLVDSAWVQLRPLFAFIPKAPVAVEPVPEYKQAGGLTYYEPASLDGKRKATFYINMSHPLPKPSMRSLTYHETIPGHHFQIATQQELTQSRLFKNLFFLSGYGEGWAMYVEELAVESGWLPDIYSRIAEINSQLFRAVRIVEDAGIHSKRWTKPQALKYMEENLGWGSANEVDRYIVWPGQACAYTLGKLKIMELRQKAERQLGDKFSLKQFHLAVLQNGSVPFELLEQAVDDYVTRSK